ncbi:unnamed protein product [Spirodela intermedia]|uniref:Reverse transcriptase Ty1/copia-type domain-containing protein n=1 Tax=Spirodela intermedia TaxID=51605 RepID=A0A7I8IP60_SPIIN|nr:unnamed protein product [Spirodela intermedia]CAA6659738.1 unnamed protein product [Spirodela intermedia]
MKGLGTYKANGDHTLFIKRGDPNKVTALIVYADDIIITGDDIQETKCLGQNLSREFDIKYLGRLKYFLGIEVAYSKGVFLSQHKYILDLLQKTGNWKGKDFDQVEKSSYRWLIERLIYLNHTRPDITFAVNVLSQYTNDPRKIHLQTAYRLLKYLKTTTGQGILFKKGGNQSVESYTNANYAGSVIDHRSTSGYCTFVCGNLVTWRSKKKQVVAQSGAEAKFRALAQGIREDLWIRGLLDELRVNQSKHMKLFCDNKSAIAIARNPVQHDRTKHIEVDRHFIKEKVETRDVDLIYVGTSEHVAGIFTKGLTRPVFQRLVSKLGMENIHTQLEKGC